MIVDDCLCQGHNIMMIYECTVVGGGATVWKGTAFDCSGEAILFHSINFTSQKPHTCNGGAITAHALSAENNTYTSQLNIQVDDTEGLMNKTVVCVHDSGTHNVEIGSAILNNNIITGRAKN